MGYKYNLNVEFLVSQIGSQYGVKVIISDKGHEYSLQELEYTFKYNREYSIYAAYELVNRLISVTKKDIESINYICDKQNINHKIANINRMKKSLIKHGDEDYLLYLEEVWEALFSGLYYFEAMYISKKEKSVLEKYAANREEEGRS